MLRKWAWKAIDALACVFDYLEASLAYPHTYLAPACIHHNCEDCVSPLCFCPCHTRRRENGQA